jgi:hypothetical protein
MVVGVQVAASAPGFVEVNTLLSAVTATHKPVDGHDTLYRTVLESAMVV